MMEKSHEAPIEEQASVRNLYHEFGDVTTLHGMKRAVSSHKCYQRLIWTLLVLTGASLALYQFISIVSEFQNNPVSTLVSLEYEPRLEFPAVTVCNMNRIRLSKASTVMKEIFNLSRELDASADDLNFQLDEVLTNLPHASRIELGHTMKDMLIDCKFNAEPCSANDFTVMTNLKYGNCYTYGSSRKQNDSKRYTTKTGPANGLVLEIDIEQSDYIPLTSSAGIKVLLHSDTDVPFPEDGGMVLGPGFLTSIAVKKVETHRQPPPYGTCVRFINNTKVTPMNIYAGWGYTYTDNSCKKICYQTKVYQYCNCCDVDYPCIQKALQDYKATAKNNSTIPFCNTTNKITADCINNIESQFWRNAFGCSNLCPPACDQISYDTVISSSTWPSASFIDIYEKKINRNAQLKNKTYDFDIRNHQNLHENFLKLEIYYEALNYMVIGTNPAYDWNKLLSDIGGQLGLWLGCSLLTAIELIQLFMEIVVLIFKKICKSRRAISHFDGSSTSN